MVENVDLNTHHEIVMDKLNEIDEDTDCILHKIGEDHMTSDFDSGALLGMLANKGVDPGVIAMLENCRKDGNWGDNGMLIVLFLILILGFGGNGGLFGNRGVNDVAGVDRTVVNEANYGRMMDAINTTGTRQEMAINQLAGNLNCDVNSIKSALCGLDKQLAMTNGSVINAIQSCCCNIQNKIQECCCQTQRTIENQGCQTRADIQDVRFLISSTQAAQDNLIQSQFAAQNAMILDQFCQVKMRELEATNQRLRDEIFRQSQNAQTAQILTAIANKDSISFSGTAGATAFNGTGSLS